MIDVLFVRVLVQSYQEQLLKEWFDWMTPWCWVLILWATSHQLQSRAYTANGCPLNKSAHLRLLRLLLKRFMLKFSKLIYTYLYWKYTYLDILCKKIDQEVSDTQRHGDGVACTQSCGLLGIWRRNTRPPSSNNNQLSLSSDGYEIILIGI